MYAEIGTTFNDLTDPKYWANVAPKLRPNARIRVFFDDSSQLIEMHVANAGKTWAKVQIIYAMQLTAETTVEDLQLDLRGYTVKFAGPHERFRVMDGDNNVVQSKFPTEEEARKWLVGHLSALDI